MNFGAIGYARSFKRFTSDALPRIRGQSSTISIVPPGRIPFETAPPAMICLGNNLIRARKNGRHSIEHEDEVVTASPSVISVPSCSKVRSLRSSVEVARQVTKTSFPSWLDR